MKTKPKKTKKMPRYGFLYKGGLGGERHGIRIRHLGPGLSFRGSVGREQTVALKFLAGSAEVFMVATKTEIARAFTEWERRYREDPEGFQSEAVKLLRETPKSYGEACTPLLSKNPRGKMSDVVPVKLTHRKRHAVYKLLRAGVASGHFAGRIPFGQLEKIWTEFHPGRPKDKPDGRLRGIRGNNWFCEAGCGAVLSTKADGLVFKAPDRSKGQRYVCAACLEAGRLRRLAQEAG